MSSTQECPSCKQQIASVAGKCPLCRAELSAAPEGAAEGAAAQGAQAQEALKQAADELRTGSFGRSALLGAGATVLSAAIWFGLIVATSSELGLIALGAGWLVGQAVFLGGWQGRKSQILGACLGIVAVLLGKYLYFYWITPDILKSMAEKGAENPEAVRYARSFTLAAVLYWPLLVATTSATDIIFFLGAAYEGWMVPQRCAMKALLEAAAAGEAGSHEAPEPERGA